MCCILSYTSQHQQHYRSSMCGWTRLSVLIKISISWFPEHSLWFWDQKRWSDGFGNCRKEMVFFTWKNSLGRAATDCFIHGRECLWSPGRFSRIKTWCFPPPPTRILSGFPREALDPIPLPPLPWAEQQRTLYDLVVELLQLGFFFFVMVSSKHGRSEWEPFFWSARSVAILFRKRNKDTVIFGGDLNLLTPKKLSSVWIPYLAKS